MEISTSDRIIRDLTARCRGDQLEDATGNSEAREPTTLSAIFG
jgi:hypothetical protein